MCGHKHFRFLQKYRMRPQASAEDRISCLTIGVIGSRCVHRPVGVRLWTCPHCPHLRMRLQTYARMRSNVLTRERICVRSQTRSRKRPCLHISAVPFPITLPGER